MYLDEHRYIYSIAEFEIHARQGTRLHTTELHVIKAGEDDPQKEASSIGMTREAKGGWLSI